MNITINNVFLGVFMRNSLRSVHLLYFSSEEIMKIKSSVEKQITELLSMDLEKFTIEMIFEPREYRLEKENMNKIEKEFCREVEDLIYNSHTRDFSKLKSAKERAVFITFSIENLDYVAIFKIPRGGILENKKFLMYEKKEAQFIEEKKGIELPNQITAIYFSKNQSFLVKSLHDFDELLLSHEVKTELAKKNFEFLQNGSLKISGLPVTGLQENWFGNLKYRELLALYRYDENEMNDFTSDQIAAAVNHHSIPNENRLEVKENTIIIKDQSQMVTLVYLLSNRILMNLITRESNIKASLT